jgi:hypothetical protein
MAGGGGVAGVSSGWGGVSVDYLGGGGRCCDGRGARAHGLGHLVVGCVKGGVCRLLDRGWTAGGAWLAVASVICPGGVGGESDWSGGSAGPEGAGM